MPSFELDNNDAMYQIRSYAKGHLKVNDTVYDKSLILTANQLIENWRPQTVDDLQVDDFLPIIQLKPTILLIGTGPKHVLLPLELYGGLINLGIGVEVMETSAAARTFNALTAEARDVAAALIIS